MIGVEVRGGLVGMLSFINPSRENSQSFFPYEQLKSVGFLLLSL